MMPDREPVCEHQSAVLSDGADHLYARRRTLRNGQMLADCDGLVGETCGFTVAIGRAVSGEEVRVRHHRHVESAAWSNRLCALSTCRIGCNDASGDGLLETRRWSANHEQRHAHVGDRSTLSAADNSATHDRCITSGSRHSRWRGAGCGGWRGRRRRVMRAAASGEQQCNREPEDGVLHDTFDGSLSSLVPNGSLVFDPQGKLVDARVTSPV